MSGKRKSPKAKKPLHREDLHKHPQQGRQPYVGPASHRHPDETPVWGPYAGYPMIMQTRGVGASGFTTGDTQIPGVFAGVAPRNYTKTDQRVLDDVCELLTRHGELDVRNVDVHCRNGVIRLEGTVISRWMRREIEAASESVFGVEDVENHLTVEPAGKSGT